MKRLFNNRSVVLFLFLSIISVNQTFSQVGIGTTNPNPSAALDIESTQGGLLIPRMTLAQISALTVDASTSGLLVYRTDTSPGFYFFNGTSWSTFSGSVDNDWTIVGNNMYNANSGNVGVGTGATAPANKLHVQHNQDGAGVMRIQNNSDGGFAGIYFNQNDSYRGHIGYVNTGGASTFGGKGAFQIAAGNRPFVITNGTTELYSESLRITQDKKLRIFRNASASYWDTYIDTYNDYNFAFNGVAESYIEDGTGAYVQYSDRRLKNNISPMEMNTLEKFLALNPVNYHYKKDKNKRMQNGLIAQEVQQLFPELVGEKNGYLTVNYNAFGVLAIKAIQEQQKIITLQEKKIKRMEEDISAIKQMLLDKK
ncbi:tail fiber domain-containing protein [Lacinutrix neustonica]|uniref:Tail fiber domain-containing protein n=1 Tax=Lacinutrix neustonica TaxID=2980107 RepID=A0A9E8MW59_9FLAO|nr:tail fiber domain-containing protein [Lacinutrix neustonica]WAC01722.1 tail fiber domain-containing protein [Lacinutrix neustonica]